MKCGKLCQDWTRIASMDNSQQEMQLVPNKPTCPDQCVTQASVFKCLRIIGLIFRLIELHLTSHLCTTRVSLHPTTTHTATFARHGGIVGWSDRQAESDAYEPTVQFALVGSKITQIQNCLIPVLSQEHDNFSFYIDCCCMLHADNLLIYNMPQSSFQPH